MSPVSALIVDDEPDLRRLARLVLEHTEDGLAVVGEASSGQEALSLLEDCDPDVVVLDLAGMGRHHDGSGGQRQAAGSADPPVERPSHQPGSAGCRPRDLGLRREGGPAPAGLGDPPARIPVAQRVPAGRRGTWGTSQRTTRRP